MGLRSVDYTRVQSHGLIEKRWVLSLLLKHGTVGDPLTAGGRLLNNLGPENWNDLSMKEAPVTGRGSIRVNLSPLLTPLSNGVTVNSSRR